MAGEQAGGSDRGALPRGCMASFLEAVPSPALAIEAGGRIEDANLEASRLLGYTQTELRGLRAERLIPTRHRARYRQLQAAVLNEQLVQRLGEGRELSVLTKDEREIPVEHGLSTLRTDSGSFALMLFVDLGPIRASEEKFAKIAGASPLAIGVTEVASGRVLDVNEAFERTFEVTRDQAIGDTMGRFWQDADARLRMLERMREQGYLRDYEIEAQTLGGKAIDIQLSSEFVVISGTPCLISFALDVTERRKSERALRESEEKFSKAFNAAPYGVSLVDLETDTYLDVNGGFERLFGGKKEQVVGRRVLDLPYWPDPSARARYLELVRRQGSVRELPTRGQHASGAPLQGLVSAEIVEIGGRHCLLTFARDVTEQLETERKKAALEAQLRDAQKLDALGTLAGGIAHDFNNILSAFMAYTDLILMEREDPAAVESYVGELRRASQRARDLVQQILTFSRRQTHERKPVRIDIAVREAIKLLRSTVPATIAFEFFVEPELPIILADPSHIHQVVMNLGTNAAHAMRERPGKLSIRLEAVDISDLTARSRRDLRPGRNVRLLVSDTGAGMDSFTKKRIFEPFFTTKGPGEGTGLGLAVVHGIVLEHEASIAVESRLGEGTSFEIHFPEHPVELADDGDVAATLARGRGESVLLVDDEPSLRHSLSRLLQRLGYDATVCSGPVEAIDLFGANPHAFDLVLSDLSMPGMTGIEMAKQMLVVNPRARIVVMSGFSATWNADTLRDVGILDLLAKPISAAELARTLRNALDRKPAASREAIR